MPAADPGTCATSWTLLEVASGGSRAAGALAAPASSATTAVAAQRATRFVMTLPFPVPRVSNLQGRRRRTSRAGQERAHVGDRPEVPELVRVDDRADRAHRAVGDVECEDVDDVAVRVAHDRARLAVDLPQLDGDRAGREAPAEIREQPRHAVGAGDRTAPLRDL